jgi:hypothetical protein
MRFVCAVVLILGLALPAEAMEGVTMKRFATFAFTICFALSLSVSAFSQARDRAPAKRPGTDRGEVRNPTPRPQTPRDVRPAVDVRPGVDKETKIPSTNKTGVDRNEQLQQRVASMLPNGMTWQQASSGFKSQGQCIAALHASKNLGIPFTELKAQMAGPNGKTLAQAIQTLRPDMEIKDARVETQKAEQQAKLTQQ